MGHEDAREAIRHDARRDAGADQLDEMNPANDTTDHASAQARNSEQELSRADMGAAQMGSPELGVLGTSGEMSNQDDVAGFGPKGAGGLHGVPPTWYGTPLAKGEEQAEQGGNPPATTPVPEQGSGQGAARQAAGPAGASGASRNDWQVSAGEAAAADQESATGTEPHGSFGPVGGSGSISAAPGAPNPD